jgi:hypothetical protein
MLHVSTFYVAHDNEFMGTHDANCDTFVIIAWDVDFHVQWKQLHLLTSTTFHSFRWQIDIMFTKDGIHTLVDVVIADPIWVNLFRWSYAIGGFATFEIAKKRVISTDTSLIISSL